MDEIRGRRGQENHRAAEIVGTPPAAGGRALGNGLAANRIIPEGLGQFCFKKGRGDGIDIDPLG